MRRMKFVYVFVMLLGLIVLSPSVVFGGAVTAAPLLQQRIYSITEIESPSPYHITIVVRTGLNTGDVWVQRANEFNSQGLLLSYGESQKVWQISHMLQSCSSSVIVNANHVLVSDENLVSQVFRIGSLSSWIDTGDSSNRNQTASSSSNVTITPTVEIHTMIAASSQEQGTQFEDTNTATVWHGINIVGDGLFVERTLRAMEAVEQGPRWAFDYIITYLDYVVQHSIPRRIGSGGHINVRTRTFYVYQNTYTHDVMWYASALVHEAVHARQYREHLESYGDTPPRRNTFNDTFERQMRIEMEALDIQIRFLEEAGAPRRIIEMAQSFIGTVWWR